MNNKFDTYKSVEFCTPDFFDTTVWDDYELPSLYTEGNYNPGIEKGNEISFPFTGELQPDGSGPVKAYDELQNIIDSGEFETAIVLNTLMYTDAFEGINTKKPPAMLEVINTMSNSNSKMRTKSEKLGALNCARTYIEAHPDSDFARLRLIDASAHYGKEYNGVFGAVSYKINKDGTRDIYVSFKGTGEGRWEDNADTIVSENSPYQKQAERWFTEVMGELGITDADKLIVTGHSKGGNMAQYVTLESPYGRYVDKVLNFYGQGLSETEIKSIKEKYGEAYFNIQRQKMYSLNSEIDYVHQLGIRIIPENHTFYFRNPKQLFDFYNAHSFYDKNGIGNFFDYETGKFTVVSGPSCLTKLAGALNGAVMALPSDFKTDVSRTVMTVAEGGFNKHWEGINGEKASFEEILGFAQCLPYVVSNLFTPEGQNYLYAAIEESIRTRFFMGNEANYALAFADVICSSVAVLCTAGVDALILMLDAISLQVSLIAATEEFYITFGNFCKNIGSSIRTWAKYTFVESAKASKAYVSEHPNISIDTVELNYLANRIEAINNSLAILDAELDSLYTKVKWSDLFKLLKSDLRIGRSEKLDKCAKYLKNAAKNFEDAEKSILKKLNDIEMIS